jgi:HlyD family secretion protein
MTRRKKRSSRKFIYLFLFTLLALGGSGYYYYDQVYLPAQITPEPEMQTAKVRTGDITISASGLGTVVPASEVALGFKTGGVIAEISAAVGEDVVEGEIFARLDDSNIQIQILEAQRDLEYLTSPYAFADAEQALFEAQEALEGAEYNQQALQEGYRSSDSTSDSTKAALILAQEKVDKAQGKFDQVAHLAEDHLKRSTALAELSAAVEARDAIHRELNWYLGETSESEQAALDSDVAIAQAEVAAAQSYLAALKGEPLPEDLFIGPALNQLWNAERALINAQVALENTTLAAPFEGTITDLNATVGQAVGTSPILTLSTLDTLWLEFYLEESDLGLLAIGHQLVVSFDAYPDHEVQATVMTINPALTTFDGSSVVQAWAQFTSDVDVELYAGMSADVELIAAEAHDALLVPVQALRELAPGSYAVFVVGSDGDLKMIPVEVGLRDFANSEILSGLEKGDVISTGTIEIGQ